MRQLLLHIERAGSIEVKCILQGQEDLIEIIRHATASQLLAYLTWQSGCVRLVAQEGAAYQYRALAP